MASTTKDTIYVDVDDEITSVIEKVRASKHKIQALVLPKRASVLQSIVNMKLLKRTADEDNKRIVLITSEASLLPIAGAVGIHVAKTLQSKPAVPSPPDVPKHHEAVVDSDDEPPLDKDKSIGELAGMPDEPPARVEPPEETIDVDNTTDDEDKKSVPAKSKGSKIKVPNFEKFRTKLMLAGAALVVLIIVWIFAFSVLPRATVTIKTNAVSVDSSFSFNASTTALSLDQHDNVVPATQKDSQQTDSQKVAATGQKNVGDKATGTMTMYYCPNNNSAQTTVTAGTVFTNGDTSFQADTSVVVPASNFTGGGDCKKDISKTVKVTASQPGTKYNVSSRAYSSSISGVSAAGSDMSGGSDKTITVVSQSDIDGAKKKITDNTDAAKKDLTKQFQDNNLFPLAATLLPGKQTVSTDAKVGDQTTEVTVTVQTDYTMLGVKRDDLKKLVNNDVKKHIDTSKQALSDDGLDQANFSISSKKSPTNQTLSVDTSATAGAQIDTASVKKQIAGKKRGDVQQIVQGLPSVDSVTVGFSPFWVYKVPSNTGKINIVVQKTQASTNNNGSSSN